MNKVILACIILSMSLLFTPPAFSHCEIPCGIYGDEMRFDMIEEHVKTVETAMNKIVELSEENDRNYNQLVRWINNKQNHASYIQDIVYQYFMTQRVKPADEKDPKGYEKYSKQITLLHKMLIHAMKAKQTTDLAHVEKLRSLLADFRAAYFSSEEK